MLKCTKWRSLIGICCGVLNKKDEVNILDSPYFTHMNVSSVDFRNAAEKASHLINVFKEVSGVPGVSVKISIAGVNVFSKAVGYADIEQGVETTPNTVFRIASISKCFTSLLVGRLLDQGKLNLEDDIRAYLPDFSPKTPHGETCRITIRNLLSHTSGIRHYIKPKEEKNATGCPEMFNTKRYNSMDEALGIFCNDPLVNAPGEDYTYSTFGFTALSAVIESAVVKSSSAFEKPTRLKPFTSKEKETDISIDAKFSEQLADLFYFLGLKNTYLDYPEKIIPFRTKQYFRCKMCHLKNSPQVDSSYKWGGGGIMSTTGDLIQLANHLSDIYTGSNSVPGVISRETLIQLWTPVHGTVQGRWLIGGLYGLGWFVARRSGLPADAADIAHPDRLLVGHLGGAVGGSTALILSLPLLSPLAIADSGPQFPALCVVVLANLERAAGIGLLAAHLVDAYTDALLAGTLDLGTW